MVRATQQGKQVSARSRFHAQDILKEYPIPDPLDCVLEHS